jgi:hypothetical protein
MSLPKSLLLAPVLSFALAVAAGAGACNGSVAFTFSKTAPTGDSFPQSIGSSCSGLFYQPASVGTGYEVCESGVWQYTADNPSSDGYTMGGGGTTITINTEPPPAGVTPVIPIGSTCEGDVYVALSTGYEVCDDGVWVYSTSIPSGYTVYTGSTSGGDSGVIISTPPTGAAFPFPLGSACDGDVYVDLNAGEGYEVCDEGAWAYSVTLPSGYTLDTDVGDDGGTTTADAGFGDAGFSDGGFPSDASIDASLPPGVVVECPLGETCTGDVYLDVTQGSGYEICEEGEWQYSTSIPSGYTICACGCAMAGSTGDDAG